MGHARAPAPFSGTGRAHLPLLLPGHRTLQAVRYSEERRIEFWAEVMLRDAGLSDEDYDIKRDARHRWLKGPSMAPGQDEQGCPCPVCVWLWRVNNYQPEKETEE